MIELMIQLSTISTSTIPETISELKLLKAEVVEILFLMSLIGTTIEDGGKRGEFFLSHVIIVI